MNTNTNLQPKVILVTGASAGFGAAISKRLAAAGHKVIATARRLDRLQQLAEDFPENILPLTLDVTDPKAVEAAVARLPFPYSLIDVVVNNAGLALGLEPAQRASISDWERMIDTNCKGMMYVTHAVLPSMVDRGVGHIVNLGSVAGTYPYPGGNVYGASKAFVHQFSLNLRSDLHGTGVRVSCIEPGMCGGTEFSEVRFGGDKAKAKSIYAGVNALTAEDISETIAWVISQPEHVNINTIELMPVNQSFAAFQINRSA